MSLYQERCYVDCQQSLILNKRLNTQVRWVKHNGHTHSTSHWTRKNQMIHFPKPEGPVWADELQRLFFKYRMFQFLLPSFQWLVFGGTSIKAFPLSLLWRLLVSPTKYTHPKPLWAILNPSLWWSCDLWENLSGGLRESSLWALEHLSFVKQSLWHLLLLEVKPPRQLGVTLELPRLWWVMRKFMKVRFASEMKETRASEVRKMVERELAWS
jgi:hypothetical protein